MPNDSASVPPPTISPEDDATLQAIEALEVQAIDPDPEPFVAVPKPQAPVQVNEPVKPTPPPVQKPAPVAPPVVEKVVAPVPTPQPQAPVSPVSSVQPKAAPKKVSDAIAEELANAPATASRFNFFAMRVSNPKAMKLFLIVAGVVLIIGALATYFIITLGK